MKIGLSLGGGGSKGFAHIGVIRALIEAGIPIDIINGTSIGAIVGGAYALYVDVDKLLDLTREVVGNVNINYFNIYRYSLGRQPFLRNWLKNAVCNVVAMRSYTISHKNNLKGLHILFGDHTFGDCQIPFSAIAMDLIAGQTVIIDRGKLADGILASGAIPGIFPPVPRGKRLLVDGYVLANIPVRELRQRGADFIISVELVTVPEEHHQNGLDIVAHVERAKQHWLNRWEKEDSDFNIPVRLAHYDGMRFDNYVVAMNQGYRVTKKLIPGLKKRLTNNRG